MMMDEPSMGLSPLVVEQVGTIIRNVNSQGIGIMLVEQNARMALDLAHRAYVLEAGRCVLEGEAIALAEDGRVKHAYLGG
jgi:branched-chain amino acid transport system ATP-binding protein